MSSSNEDAYRQGCLEYFDTMLYCYTPVNQFSAYYRTGWVDDCARARNQFLLCINLKFNIPDEERVQLHRKLKRKGEFTETADIWKIREDPAKAWQATSTEAAPETAAKH